MWFSINILLVYLILPSPIFSSPHVTPSDYSLKKCGCCNDGDRYLSYVVPWLYGRVITIRNSLSLFYLIYLFWFVPFLYDRITEILVTHPNKWTNHYKNKKCKNEVSTNLNKKFTFIYTFFILVFIILLMSFIP